MTNTEAREALEHMLAVKYDYELVLEDRERAAIRMGIDALALPGGERVRRVIDRHLIDHNTIVSLRDDNRRLREALEEVRRHTQEYAPSQTVVLSIKAVVDRALSPSTGSDDSP